MTSIADGSVIIQTSSESVPCPPPWFGEIILMARHLGKQGVLAKICERVRFARRRFGHYEVIDFLAVLFGYARSFERTLTAFYEAVQPFAVPFMALFGRDRLPSRSALSRFLSTFPWAAVEALRSLFLEDLLARPLDKDRQIGELVDRCEVNRLVFDIDGTREAARQRALPKGENLPGAHRRLEELCAPGYTGRKRGEVVRTRTVVSQAHSSQWLGSFGNKGNGLYREELAQVLCAIRSYLAAHQLPQERALLRLDGQYGTGAVQKRAGWFLVCAAWQRLCRVGPSARPGTAAPAPRSAPAACLQASSRVPSTTALRYQWDQRVCRVVSWWRPIRQARRRAAWA